MKRLLLVLSVLSLSLGVDRSGYAQGTIVFNNLGPNDGKVFTLFTGQGSLLNQDLNFSLFVHRGGPSVRETVRTWLLSDGTARGINVGPGLFADPTQSVIVLTETSPGFEVVVSIGAWAGNYPTWEAASSAGIEWGESTWFRMVAGTLEAPPASLVGMPDFPVGIPEPRILSLAMVGMALFVVGRMRGGSKART